MLRKSVKKSDIRQEKPGATPLDEAALLDRVANGDVAAFEILYRCYFPRLQRFLQRITRRPQLVEEILNDTMLVIWRKAATYNLQSKVSTWIFAIAYRRALKALSRIDDVINEDPAIPISEFKHGPEGELMRQELRLLLMHTMSGLSAEHRAVIELTYYQGYAYGEIAEIMSCPIETVKTRMFYARRKLKTLLGNNMGDLI